MTWPTHAPTTCHRCAPLGVCVCGGVAELLDAPPPDEPQDDQTDIYRPAPVAGA